MTQELALDVVVLAAGKGTRMRQAHPKVLSLAYERALLHWVLDAVQPLQCRRIAVVVGYAADEVRDAALTHACAETLSFAPQPEQRGTGDAVRCGLAALDADVPGDAGYVLVVNGDCPLVAAADLQACADAAFKSGAELSLCVAEAPEPEAYGRILRDESGAVARIVEAADATPAQRAIREINPGIYCVARAALREAVAGLQSNNAQGEFYATDIIAHLAARGKVVDVTVPFSHIQGVNDPLDLAEVQSELHRRRLRALVREGVRVADLARVQVSYASQVAPGALLGLDVSLSGSCRIAAGAELGQGCVLTDSELEAGAQLLPYCVLSESSLGEAAVAGPFAHLRPGTRLERKAKLGNFCEAKKTRLGAGSKASHLSYLGDAEVGEGVNIGAGTIICNYDGYRKWPTQIEDGAFVGSDSQLVAPLRIGKGAYVGTGSTITQDVPADALAVSRGRQSNKLDYGPRLRKRLAARKPE